MFRYNKLNVMSMINKKKKQTNKQKVSLSIKIVPLTTKSLTNTEALTLLCSIVQHVGSG